MSDAYGKNDHGDDDDVSRQSENERLDDLEPAEREGAVVKGGGPRDQTTQTGGGPED